MPSTMIHLLVAHQLEPIAPDMFWVGNFAPDYTNDRELKDKIHFRSVESRWAALAQLYTQIDMQNPFERGWFLHLFADACWDEKELIDYKKSFEARNDVNNWFLSYREEIGLATYFLYHNLSWANDVWKQIEHAELYKVDTMLPITLSENEWYRDRVAKKHSESNPESSPRFFSIEMLNGFAASTASRLNAWVNEHG